MNRGMQNLDRKITFLLSISFLLFCMALPSVSTLNAMTIVTNSAVEDPGTVYYLRNQGSGQQENSIMIEAKGSSVLLNGMNIAEKAKGQDLVSSNLMVTYSMGPGKIASTASVPSKYSSTGALIQYDFGKRSDSEPGLKWFYLKEVGKSGENIFEGKEQTTVNWEYPLLESQDWKPAGYKDNLVVIPEGEDAHFITNGDLVLPGQFIIYSADDDQDVATAQITDPTTDCSSPSTRCSATLKTSELDNGYYYVVYTWESDGKTYISNPLGVKIGDPKDSGKEKLVLTDAQTGEETTLFWTPKYVQSYGTWGNVNNDDKITVYRWNDNPPGISIGSAAKKVEYDLSSLGFTGLSFSVETDWKTYTTLVFSNNKMIDLVYEDGSILMIPSALGDWGKGISLTSNNDTINTSTVTVAAQAPEEKPKEEKSASIEVYNPTYPLAQGWQERTPSEREVPSVMLSSLTGLSLNSADLKDIRVQRDIADPLVIGIGRISGSAIRFSNLIATGGLRYSWSFGDGASSDEEQPIHEYAKSGSYLVTLTTTDADGNAASKSVNIEVENGRTSIFGKIFGFIIGIFTGDEKESYTETGASTGGLVTVTSQQPVKITVGEGYSFGTTDPNLATVDANGIVTFTENFVEGSKVGILASDDDGQLLTVIQYSKQQDEGTQLIVVGDSLLDANGNPHAIMTTTTQNTLDQDISIASSETSDVGVEEIKGHVESGARDALGELVKLKGEGWSQAYELIRKAYEGGETVKGISDESCKCFENLLEYFKSSDEVSASLNFYSFCMCIYGFAGDSRVSFIGEAFCKAKMPDVPNPADMPSEVRESWVKNLNNIINECKDPGYLEKKAAECKKAKKDCEEARKLVDQAKEFVAEAKQAAEKAEKARADAERAYERVTQAWDDASKAEQAADVVAAANRAIQAAQEAEQSATEASQYAAEAKAKHDQAIELFYNALDLCPGTCSPEDGSSAVISQINEERAKMRDIPNYEYASSSAVLIAGLAGASTSNLAEFASAKVAAEKKKSCEKALELAKAAVKAADMIGPLVSIMSSKLKRLAESQDTLALLEEEAVRIRAKERFERGMKLNGISSDANEEVKYAEQAAEDSVKLQAEIQNLAEGINKIISQAEQALAEGDPEDPSCLEAKKLIQEAKEKILQATKAASDAVSASQQKLDTVKQHKAKIDEIRDEWERKRRTIRAYTYTNSDGKTVIWGGNGDAQPPKGAVYHGTMQGGKWIDGGPPPIS